MTSQTETAAESPLELYEPYRAVSKAAIAALVLGLIGLAGLLLPVLLAAPLAGTFCGVIALINIRRYPLELTGKIPALLGLSLSTVLLAVGTALHGYLFMMEVPEGYQPISFADLAADEEHPEWPIPPSALQLHGQKVFVKGYVYPGGQQNNIQHFVLVRDMGSCCFGGQPPLTHMILVTLQDPLRVDYALRKRGLGGVLKVSTRKKPVSGLDGVLLSTEGGLLEVIRA